MITTKRRRQQALVVATIALATGVSVLHLLGETVPGWIVLAVLLAYTGAVVYAYPPGP